MNFLNNTGLNKFTRAGAWAGELHYHRNIVVFVGYYTKEMMTSSCYTLYFIRLSVLIVRHVITLYTDFFSVVLYAHFAKLPGLQYPYPLNDCHSEEVVMILTV